MDLTQHLYKLLRKQQLNEKQLRELSPQYTWTSIKEVMKSLDVHKLHGTYYIPKERVMATSGKPALEITSFKNNTYRFVAAGDLHAGSKYCRWDVREALALEGKRFGAQAWFDTGNYIEGESRFNRHELQAVGMDNQVKLLSSHHPRVPFPIYAVDGDDHEGWYAQREGVDIGKYTETIMREGKHDWTTLGYMEADVILRNANSGKCAVLRVAHPGGGSSYALSYSIQKIIESYEGGEKPHVGFYGHYHKLMAMLIRNVWTVQTGTQQDQTTFMRKKRLEAHVGGALVELHQDPKTGAIMMMCPSLYRYFGVAWTKKHGIELNNRWSHTGSVSQARRTLSGGGPQC